MTRHMTYDPVTRVTGGKTSELLLLGCYEYLDVKLGWFGFFFLYFSILIALFGNGSNNC